MKNLSKSQFTRGLQCPKSLWLYRERKDLQDPVPPDQQAIFDQGTSVGMFATMWIKGGVLIKADHRHPEEALAETQAAIAGGAQVLYEAAFLHDEVLVRLDIIQKNIEGSWDIYEVKSTTKVEEVHYKDAAIQAFVAANAGIKLGRVHVVHLDPAYVRYGPLLLEKLFTAVDVTDEIEAELVYIPKALMLMKAMANDPKPPEVAIGPHCTKPHDCSFIGHCWAHVPEYSVFNLAGARMDKKTELWNRGIKTISEIPLEEKLTAYQTIQRDVTRIGVKKVSHMAIQDLLNTLTYPQHFLDFEAINPAIPYYDGTRPYQALPFEASIHIRRKRGAALEHFEYLADGTKDPRPELTKFLQECIGRRGSVIAYNKSYEGGILKGLASFQASAADMLLDAEKRLWDLADIFRKGHWAEPKFEGSWSIKKVLPVLVPEMTYKGMAIADGVAAMQAYARLMDDKTLTPEQRAQIMADLRAYCGQDTIAMVRILDRVEAAVGATA